MANLQRIECTMTIPGGGSGVSIFYASESDTTAVAALLAFWTTALTPCVSGTTVVVPGSGDTIDEATGALVGVWTQSGSGTATISTGAASYAAGVGGVVNWLTSGVVHNRRVKWRTFVTPFRNDQYDLDGSLGAAAVGSLQSAAGTLVADSDLRIWSRPFAGTPKIPSRSGSSHPVIAGLVPDRVAWLRSRRS